MTRGTNGQERRLFDRFNINLPLEATFQANGKQQVLRSRSINISAGGACFPSTLDLEPGTYIGMRIMTPAGSLGGLFPGSVDDSTPVLIRSGCEVVHCAEACASCGDYRLGVRFSGPMRICKANNGISMEELEETTPTSSGV